MKNYDDKKRVSVKTDLGLLYFTREELRKVTHVNPGESLDRPESFYSPALLDMLDRMRHVSDLPIILNSGFRCAAYNKKVGGSRTSAHMSGFAMDIACSDPEHRFLYIRAALAVGFTRIGIGHTFLHLDIDTTKTQDCIWHYK